jgi:hypothetical protein
VAVIIEELQAEVASPARESGSAESVAPGQPEPMDERKVLEAIAREWWRMRRLEAD